MGGSVEQCDVLEQSDVSEQSDGVGAVGRVAGAVVVGGVATVVAWTGDAGGGVAGGPVGMSGR